MTRTVLDNVVSTDDTPTLSRLRDEAAMVIPHSGSIQLAEDMETGEFELQIHRTHPGAPLSPVYLALRPDGVKTGKLKSNDFDVIGQAMALYANELGLFEAHRYVAGIPAAGVPFTKALHDWLNSSCFNMSRLNLRKVGEGASAKILPPPPEDTPELRAMQDVLLVDDLVTKAGTKKQAIRAIESAGGCVTDLLVFVDRSGGRARKELSALGVTLHALWEFDHLLEFWLGKGVISRRQFEVIIAYPDKLDAYLKGR